MDILFQILLVLFAYLCGSIPFGLILTYKTTGKDIRSLGSGNIGSTNVKRIAGRKVAIQTQILDMLKGLVPVGLVMLLMHFDVINARDEFIYLIAFSTILGHDFSIFLRFNGGKGVNTTLGASVLLAAIPVFSGVLVYYLIKYSTRYVSLASLLLSLTMIAVDLLLNGISFQTLYFILCFLLIALRHNKNIKRLLNGTEAKIDQK